jgi:hypothetical protein
MIMDDLMIMNDLEANSGVTSWSSFGDDAWHLSLNSGVRRWLCRNNGFYGVANRL